MTHFCSRATVWTGNQGQEWSYESACNICIFAKLVMTSQGHLGNLLLRPPHERGYNSVVQYKEQFCHDLRALASRVSSLPILQHDHNKSFSLHGFSLQLEWLDRSLVNSLQPVTSSLWRAGTHTHRLRMNWLQQCCLPFSTSAHLPCADASPSVGTIQGRMPWSLSLQKKGNTAP